MVPQSRSLAYLLLTLAVLGWAGNWVIGRALRFDAPPVAITFWRWAIALALLVPFTFPYLRERWRLVLRSWRILVVLGLLATVLQHIPVYAGLRHTTATNGALLNAMSPIFMVFLAALVGERLNARSIVGSLISLAGVVTVVSRGDPDVLRELGLNAGDFLVLAGTLSWAGYTVCLRWWPSHLKGLPVLTVLAAVGVLATAPLYALEIASGEVLKPTAATLLGIGYMGVVATILGYICWNGSVQTVGAARAGPFMYLMLVFTPLLSIVFLGEQLHLYHVAGAALIVAGIVLTTSKRADRAGDRPVTL
jgi:drug/metabolite transporter (DMT)-like permease